MALWFCLAESPAPQHSFFFSSLRPGSLEALPYSGYGLPRCVCCSTSRPGANYGSAAILLLRRREPREWAGTALARGIWSRTPIMPRNHAPGASGISRLDRNDSQGQFRSSLSLPCLPSVRKTARPHSQSHFGLRRQRVWAVAALAWAWMTVGVWSSPEAAKGKAVTSQTPSPQSKTLARLRRPSRFRRPSPSLAGGSHRAVAFFFG